MTASVQVPVRVRVDPSVLANRPGDVDRALREAAARSLGASREALTRNYGANVAVHLFPPEFRWTGPGAGNVGEEARKAVEARIAIALVAAATTSRLLDLAVPPEAPNATDHQKTKRAAPAAAKPTGTPPAATTVDGGDAGEPEGIHLIFSHPHGSVDEDRVIDAPSPFEGRMIAILPRWETVRVKSPRYAISTDLRRASRWGLLLFGARAWVIIEGPMNTPEQRYYVVGTNAAITLAHNEPGTGTRLASGDEVWGVAGIRHLESVIHDGAHKLYLIRALVGADGQTLFATRALSEEFYGELATGAAGTGVIPVTTAAPIVFGEIDRLIAAGETQKASERLAELDVEAFRIIGWETKVIYLRTLIKAWTWKAQERAVVEIIKSVSTPTELAGVTELLKDAGLFRQLFDDLSTGEVFSLLKVVGRQFDPWPVTLDFLYQFAQSAGMALSTRRDLAAMFVPGPAGSLVLDENFVREAYQAASALVSTLAGIFEGVWMLVTEPDKIVDAVGQLFKLIVMIEMARFGHEESQRTLAGMLRSMAQDAAYAMKGAQVLGVSDDIARRMKWTVIWEVASMFIGVGEVAAVAKGIGLGERLVALTGLLRALGVLGKMGEGERMAVRAERFARVIRATSQVIRADEEAVRLLSHLPADDLARISRLLEQHDISAAAITIRDLAKIHPELAGAAEDAMRKIELLHRLEAKAGGASDLVVSAFQSLAGPRGLAVPDIERIIAAIPEGQGMRFARAMRAIPPGEIANGRVTREMLEVLAASQRRMDTVVNAGYPTYSAVARRAGADARLLDDYLDALVDIELQYAATERRAELRRLLDGIERGDADAWHTLESARRARLGLPPEELDPARIVGWIEEELARLGEPVAPGPVVPPPGPAPLPAAAPVPTRPIVRNLRDVDLSDLSAADRARYTRDWNSYQGPIQRLDDYLRARHGYRTGQLQRGTAVGRLGETGVIEQLAGHELQRVVNARLPGAANWQSYPTRWGNCVPDHMPPGQRIRFLGPDGNVKPTGTPFSARFIGDSKYREFVPITDQTRGFVELAARSDDGVLVFYVRWQDTFPDPVTLTQNPLLGGLELPVRWNQDLVSPGLRELAGSRGVRVRVVSDPLWR